jgi:hypothetical protein
MFVHLLAILTLNCLPYQVRSKSEISPGVEDTSYSGGGGGGVDLAVRSMLICFSLLWVEDQL